MFHSPSPSSKSSRPSVFRGVTAKRPVERAARGNHAQVRVEHQKGLPYGVDDGLSQVMPMRDGGERIAFGHSQSSLTAAKILSDLMADQNSAARMRLHRTTDSQAGERKRPRERPEAASSLAVTLRGIA